MDRAALKENLPFWNIECKSKVCHGNQNLEKKVEDEI
jgi:hypothetical protein